MKPSAYAIPTEKSGRGPMIIDVHGHMPLRGLDEGHEHFVRLLARSRRFGIDKTCILGQVAHFGFQPKAHQITELNDHTAALVDRYPEDLIAFCYLNPRLGERACLREMDLRFGKQGFRGIKLFRSLNCRDSRHDPIMKRAGELGIPVLQHSWYNSLGLSADESTPADIADLAARFPKTTIIMAHLGGVRIRGICEVAPYPNISVDTSGSQPASGLVEYAITKLGAGRVIYGSDFACCRDYSSQLGRIYGAEISPGERLKILGANAKQLLKIR